jgi:hypothetical protein
MKKVLLSNVALTNQFPDELEIRRINLDGKSESRIGYLLKLVKAYRSADCVLVLNADAIHAAAAMVAKGWDCFAVAQTDRVGEFLSIARR